MRAAPRPSASPDTPRQPRPGERVAPNVRVLADEDTADLAALTAADPVAHVFVRAQLEAHGSAEARGGPVFLGHYDDGELTSACWVGNNVVPLTSTAPQARRFGQAALRLGRRFSSVFGPSTAVHGIWEVLRHGPQAAFDIRPHQPLLAMSTPPRVPPAATVRRAVMADIGTVLPACVKMFEEELGYSPLEKGGAVYKQRVEGLVQQGATLADFEVFGAEVIFKAEVGTVTQHASQIQGVWLDPKYRGRGLSAGYVAAVVRHALTLAPVTSLYVNDYNAPALAAYERVGFEQVGDYATILY
ncbi:GNAT family N-acetyltransferase [Zhihengliuella somnathii]